MLKTELFCVGRPNDIVTSLPCLSVVSIHGLFVYIYNYVTFTHINIIIVD